MKSQSKLQFWRPRRQLGGEFVVLIWQAINQRQARQQFLLGIKAAGSIATLLLGLVVFVWLVLDLFRQGFFLTLCQPSLYFSLTGLKLILSLVSWRLVFVLIISFYLTEKQLWLIKKTI